MTLTFFTVTGNYRAFTGQESWESDGVAVPASGSVIFEPVINAGDLLHVDVAGVPTGLSLKPVQATIVDGVVHRNGVVGCRLLANTPELHLAGDLFYRVKFFDVRTAKGDRIDIREFDFPAPASDAVLDLVSVQPQPGAPASGSRTLIPGPAGPKGDKGDKGDPGSIAGLDSATIDGGFA